MAKIYHLDGGSLHPYWPKIDSVSYVLLLETNQGWTLVDCGFGTRDYKNPQPFTWLFLNLMRTPREPENCIINQVRKLGIKPTDIRHIVMTHLHLDHAGGLVDFPWATVHLDRREFEAMRTRKGPFAAGYIADHFIHRPYWHLYEEPESIWYGYPSYKLIGFEPEIRLIPAYGHTLGHCMVAIQIEYGRWLLQCGDASYPFYLNEEEQFVHPHRKLVQFALGNHQKGLTELLRNHGEDIDIITSHDHVSWAKYQKD